MSLQLNIAVLNKISHLVARRTSVSEMLSEILNILNIEMSLMRGTLTLREGDMLVIEASQGLSAAEIGRGMYRVGEGITGKVALEGKPRVIADISQEKEFLNRTQARNSQNDIAFICVPIIYEDEVIGTLSMDRRVDSKTDLKSDLHLLELISNITARAIFASYAEVEEKEKLIAENRRLQAELSNKLRPENIIGSSNVMKTVYLMISKVASSNASVLIRGESGTGKELVARAIHKASQRSDKPFVAVNCAALPEGLIESELFGHEKGAFTGAINRKIGLVEVAAGGTLFLDEVGDLSLFMQLKLLRFLQERTYYRVGNNQERKVDVRIISATSRNLEEMIKDKKFREDLYYRLSVFPIFMPSLRHRKSDITTLVQFFLEKFNAIHSKSIVRISTPAINMISSYYWPGNVRELENCMEYAVLNTSDNVINGYNLPPALQSAQSTQSAIVNENDENADYETLVSNFEREIIIEALKTHKGNATSAAHHLKTTPRIMLYKIKKFGIEPDLYK